jgi:hypothetical protein
MRPLKPVLAVLTLAAAGPAIPQTCDGGIWYFSRSGLSSYSAVDARGDEQPAADLRTIRGLSPRDTETGYGVLRPVWHEASESEYAPAAVVPHGSHYDIVPDRYRSERSGYWDWQTVPSR